MVGVISRSKHSQVAYGAFRRSAWQAGTIKLYGDDDRLISPDGKIIKKPIIEDLTSETMSYTFSDPRGLLFSTQFAQPIIMLLEQAAMADL